LFAGITPGGFQKVPLFKKKFFQGWGRVGAGLGQGWGEMAGFDEKVKFDR
jgi:hypothetical protein